MRANHFVEAEMMRTSRLAVLVSLSVLLVANASTAEFFDDFSDGDADGWNPAIGSWQVINFEYVGQTCAALDTFTGDSSWGSYSLAAQMKIGTDVWNDFGIIFYAQGADDFLRFTVRPGTPLARITHVVNRSSAAELATVVNDVMVVSGEWHEIKVVLDNDHVLAFVNDVLVAEAHSLPYTQGHIGLSADCGPVYYDDILVTANGAVVEDVEIDIKPGSFPNSINLGSRGVVPVAILSEDDFDASEVDPATVTFADASPVRWALEDVDNDGDVDMILHFKIQELALDASSTEATLIGTTQSGVNFAGTDSVRIVPPEM
jgi:hypothetical protein